MRHVPDFTYIVKTLFCSTRPLAAATLPAVLALTVAASASAQSSSLPPTNMGKFVHQPGDNQYSNGTQAERHSPPPQMMVRPTAVPVQTVGYVPVPRAVRPDPTLQPIAADEPVVQAGFPPLPDRADLPVAGNSWSASSSGGGNGGGNNSGGGDSNGKTFVQGPAQTHQHYIHEAAGAYIPKEEMNKSSNPYKSKSGGDTYAVGSGGGGAGGLGKEPSLNPKLDQGIVADAPAPVVVKQATTQDLSLPDDEFSGKSTQKKNPSNSGRMMKQMAQQSILNPIRMVGSMGGSMATRAIHF